ncbi:hypothetical protein EDO6_06084 [Paenibacillus xylanexedens]|nr:hypothetical protein EDO6_06084 [Paenibacillus xylanexedens]
MLDGEEMDCGVSEVESWAVKMKTYTEQRDDPSWTVSLLCINE